MESTNAYDQQPPISMHMSAMRHELLAIISKNINAVMPFDFYLNEVTLDALKSNEYPFSILDGHEYDPLDEKQSNFVEIFVYKYCGIF